jgi:hypothetical protein
LDRWLDAMRVAWPTPGYGGPVVHWWGHCLAYRGTGLDWRYEGIVDGYLALWRLCDDRRWLGKAIRAGDDLVAAQLPNGCWPNSRFELNPGSGGTPHEAACDVALLTLAAELRTQGDPAADRYLAAADRNLSEYWLGRLWHRDTATLWDSEQAESFVPNKAATFLEAILLFAGLTGDDDLVTRYGIPIGDDILAMQVHRTGDILDGAIAQNRFGERVVESFFPLYVARCVPALAQLATRTGESRFGEAALAAAGFVGRVREPDGGLPQVLYGGGRRNRQPRWIAGAGDVLRALDVANQRGLAVDPGPTIDWILRGTRPDGRIAAAQGFGTLLPVVSRRDRDADEIGVVGWCDKAFRVLARLVDPAGTVEPGPPPRIGTTVSAADAMRAGRVLR